jgi:hypothetical protein
MNDRIGTRRQCKYNLRATNDADEATDLDDLFGFSSFIAPTIVQFLGVRSLVRFGITSKYHKAVMLGEVERRRKQIVAVEVEVAKLIAPRPDAVPTRMNVIAATKLVECTRCLIDDELEFHHKIGSGEFVIGNEDDIDEYDWYVCDPFFQDRMKFFPDPADLFPGSAGERQVGTLYVLPMCFYCPPEGESSQPSYYYKHINISNPCREAVAEATEYAHEIWGAEEDLMQSVYNDRDMEWDRLNYEQPLRKFKLSGADRFTEFVSEKTGELVWGMADAFRIAARDVFFKNPGARDCLWYTIEELDSSAHLTEYIKGAKIRLKLMEVESLLTPNLVERFHDIHRSVLADNSLDLDDKIEEMAAQLEAVLKSTEGRNISTKRKLRIMRIMRKLPPMPYHVEY